MTWQPIETAPKDGTKVLIYSDGEDEIFSAHYEHGCWQAGIWTSPPIRFTHWMPLPEPPEKDKG